MRRIDQKGLPIGGPFCLPFFCFFAKNADKKKKK